MNFAPSYTLKTAWLAVCGGIFALVLGCALAVTVNTYADIRIPLPLLPDIHFEGWKPKAERLQGAIDGFERAQKDAAAAQQKVNDDAERGYASDAKENDDEHTAAKARTDDATARYIAGNRLPAGGMCPTDRGSPGPTDPAAESDGAGVPEGLPADPFVAVKQSDVQRCSDLAPYAVKAHDWARDAFGED